MDPVKNPFAPGAGNNPPEMAGRERTLEDARIALKRIRAGKHARGQFLLGLRGVGKTVLLNRIEYLASQEKYQTIVLEAPEDQKLVQMLVPRLRALLLRLSRIERSKEMANRSMKVLRAFAGVFKVTIGEMEFGVGSEPGTADSGNLEIDLPELFQTVLEAAKGADEAVALFIDEVQYLSTKDLSALIVAVHRMSQKQLPFILFGAGLPQLAALAGEAKSYAERLFNYPEIGALEEGAAREAIVAPLEKEGVAIEPQALDLMVRQTQGYPYFLQEWGYHTWEVASASPITPNDVTQATNQALRALDQGFFRVRLDRLTPKERSYVRAMAELGPGPHRSGEIAQVLKSEVTAVGPLRNGLIKKGMIYSPKHGDTAFTVPMFDQFLLRSMPDWNPGETVITDDDTEHLPRSRKAKP